jgi:hypothetical protein
MSAALGAVPRVVWERELLELELLEPDLREPELRELELREPELREPEDFELPPDLLCAIPPATIPPVPGRRAA